MSLIDIRILFLLNIFKNQSTESTDGDGCIKCVKL